MSGWKKQWPGVYTDNAQIICGDSLEVLRDRGDGSVHCVVTDPPYELAFMGKVWDGTGIAFNEKFWAEVLRVLKPGGHVVSFGGTRTFHRLTCGIEDAGFEIRDCLSWLYGTGFPKSLDVSKAMAKVGANGQAEQWQGFGTALKPGWEPIILARKPLVGTVAANVLAHGTGALNIDATRIAANGEKLGGGAEKQTRSDQKGNEGWTRPWMEDEEAQAAHAARVRGNVVKAETLGRWPANVVLTHAEGCVETVAAWECAEGCPVAELDAQAGTRTSGVPGVRRKPHETDAMSGRLAMTGKQETGYGDTGGVSRFFYVTKAGKKERPSVDGVNHPTVKPLDLMRWLVRMVTPPEGIVLDPFAGSGTTVEAAVLEGFRCIGIESEPTYIPLIEARLARIAPETEEVVA